MKNPKLIAGIDIRHSQTFLLLIAPFLKINSIDDPFFPLRPKDIPPGVPSNSSRRATPGLTSRTAPDTDAPLK